MNKNKLRRHILFALMAASISPVYGQIETSFSENTYKILENSKNNTSIKNNLNGNIGDLFLTVGGRIKADFYYDNDGRQTGTYGLDVAALPLEGIDFNAQRKGNFNGTLVASRLNLDAYKVFGRIKSHGFLEIDFNGNSSTTTSSYGMRLRFAYGEFMDEQERHIFLLGQTWTNFAHVEAIPKTLNNVPSSCRLAQLRYTNRVTSNLSVSIALEKPNVQYLQNTGDSTTTGYMDNNSSNSNSKSSLPDLTMRLKFKNKRGQLSLSGVARKQQVKAIKGFSSALTDYNSSKIGWGVGIAAVLKISEPLKFIAQIMGGKGIGRYINDLSNQNAMDSYFQYATAQNMAINSYYETLKAIHYNLGITVNWTKSFNSTIGGAYTKVYSPSNMITTSIFHKSMQRYHANLIYNILPDNQLGIEVEHYKRKTGVPVEFKGQDTRFVVSYIYTF